jgi:hypothetical protein
VKTAVVESVKEAEKKSGTGTITIKRNGRVIQITTKDEPAPAGTAAPAAPAATATPAVPPAAKKK